MQKEFDDPLEDQDEQVNSSVALFLALMLLVLAFFIIMVSISQVKIAKSKAALKSIATTFASIKPTSTQLTFVSNSKGEADQGQQVGRSRPRPVESHNTHLQSALLAHTRRRSL